MRTQAISPDLIEVSPPQESSVLDFFLLLKPRVMSLVIFTALMGTLAAPFMIHPFLCFITILSIALGAGASGAMNMWYDSDIDRIMKRTRNRPIPAGRMQRDIALQFGMFLAVLSVALLYLATNALAAGLLAFSIFFYVVPYTMLLKRSTPQNIVIGGAAGAFPPVIGWAAMTNSLTFEPILLFLIIFLWTPSHFWALALYKSEEYEKAGIPMLPVVSGLKTTKIQILIYSHLLVGASLIPYFLGFSGLFYFVSVSLMGAFYLYLAFMIFMTQTQKYCRQLFGYSIIYLFLLFLAVGVDKVIP